MKSAHSRGGGGGVGMIDECIVAGRCTRVQFIAAVRTDPAALCEYSQAVILFKIQCLLNLASAATCFT